MSEGPLRILVIGAYPDDGDIKAGGTAAKWCALGHVVQFLSLTNGQAGHHTMYGPRLARRRRAECSCRCGHRRRATRCSIIPTASLTTVWNTAIK